jgi:hypothetical protein
MAKSEAKVNLSKPRRSFGYGDYGEYSRDRDCGDGNGHLKENGTAELRIFPSASATGVDRLFNHVKSSSHENRRYIFLESSSCCYSFLQNGLIPFSKL